MTNRTILGPGTFDNVPFHEHDFNDISGKLVVTEAEITSLSASKITAGTIGVEVIKLSDSPNSRIESFDGTSLVIRGDGSFVGTSVTLTGEINATTGTLTTLTVDGTITIDPTTGLIRTATSGNRLELSGGDPDRVSFYTGLAGESSNAYITGEDAGGGIPRLQIVGPVATTGKTSPSNIQIFGQSGVIDISAKGNLLLNTDGDVILTAGVSGTNTVWVPTNGSVTIPALMVGDDTDGFYRPATNELAMSLNNAEAFRVSETLLSGNALDWQTWTPTYTNITVGNGTVVARYVQIGKLVVAVFEFTLGSTSTMGSAPTVSTPVTAAAGYTNDRNWVGGVYMIDVGTASYPGVLRLNTVDKFQPLTQLISTTYLNDANLTSAIPFTWTTSDVLAFTATYEAA